MLITEYISAADALLIESVLINVSVWGTGIRGLMTGMATLPKVTRSL